MHYRNTALHAAADTGNAALTGQLIAGGADLFAVGKGGWQPLLMAVYKGHAPVVRVLLDAGAGADDSGRPLHVAAEYGYLEILRLLLDAGVPVNARDDRGRTALDLAADDACREILQTAGGKSGADLSS